MTALEILAIVTPIVVVSLVIVTVFVANSFDDKAAEAERKARLTAQKTPQPAAAE